MRRAIVSKNLAPPDERDFHYDMTAAGSGLSRYQIINCKKEVLT